MTPPPYTIPDEDHDLWSAGCVLTPERIFATRRANTAAKPISLTVLLEARREALLVRGVRASAQGRLNWLRYLLGLRYAKPDPSHVEKWLREARKKWGEEEYARLLAIA